MLQSASLGHRLAEGQRWTSSDCVVQKGAQMYTRAMSTLDPISVSDARDQLASIINRARTTHEPVFLSRRGRRVAAVIDADYLERLIELAEDMTDIRAAEDSREEMRRTKVEPMPWDQVKADLGLV